MNTINETALPVPMIKTGSLAALAQLIVVATGLAITAGASSFPATAGEFYTIMRESPLMGFLLDDFFSILLISLYLFVVPALFLVLMKKHFTLTFFGALLSVIAVVLVLSAHTGFSLLHLSRLYWAAADQAVKTQLLAAGEALIAGNVWNSTAGFFSGIFLQGGGILLSAAMIGAGRFRKLTILSGIAANSLDLINHLMGHWLPSAAKIFLYISGPFYIIWYVMLFLDLRRLYRGMR